MKSAFLFLLLAGAALAAPPVQFDPRKPVQTTSFAKTGPSRSIAPEMLVPSKDAFRAGPGDRLEIEILGGEATRRTALVSPDGMLYYDLAPGIHVNSRTLDDIRLELQGHLVQYYREPLVSITVLEVRSKRIWVLGRLNKPGIYPLSHPTTVVDAISQAGGLFASRFSGTTEELADLDHSFIIRGNKMIPVNFASLLRNGDMKQNIYLEANDLIYLPSTLTKEINILGAVRQPRSVGYNQEMGLASAIGSALGIAPGADLRHVTIIRGSLATPQIAVVDFLEIQKGKVPDVRLQPRDIVYVPTGRWRSIAQIAELVTNTFVRSIAANEGSRAGSRNTETVRAQLTITP